MVGMTLPAIPTVQSQKSLGFSMPKRERYRAAFSKRLQLPRRNKNKRCRLADGATAKNILQDNIPRKKKKKKKPACSIMEKAGVRREQVIGGLRERKGLFYLLTLKRIYLLPTENVDLTVHHSLDILHIALYVLNACGF